jgi:mono/diheme cytochrome c family protein
MRHPLPVAMLVALAVVLCTMGTACDGSSSNGSHEADRAASASAARDSASVNGRRGEATYRALCANCHLVHGRGMVPAYRSLVNSPWVIGAPERAIAIVLYGIQGPVNDRGFTYSASMLPYGNGVPLADEVVADVVTYIRQSWGNQGEAVTAAEVAKLRARFAGRSARFTQGELDALAR